MIEHSHLWCSTGVQRELQGGADMSHSRCRGALLSCEPCDLVSSVNLAGFLLQASSVNLLEAGNLGVLLEAGKEAPHGVRSLLGLAPCLVHGLQNWKSLSRHHSWNVSIYCLP